MNARPLLLDLFCGAGGAGAGYHRAGFDVIGVDLSPQKNYPYPFLQGDALAFLSHPSSLSAFGFDAIHASPPCHDHSRYTSRWGTDGTGDLLAATRQALQKTGLPWVI